MRFLWLPVLVLGLAACASTPRYEPAELKKIAKVELRIERQWKKDIGKVGDSLNLAWYWFMEVEVIPTGGIS